MGVRDNVQKRIDAKKLENTELETRIRENKAYIQGLEDILRLLPRTADGLTASPLRAGSMLAKAHGILRKTGRPMHLIELLEALHKAPTKNNRAGLSGTLSAYVRKGEIFTRPAPNTFGLVEFGTPSAQDVPDRLIDLEGGT